jgi:hypothetical protein
MTSPYSDAAVAAVIATYSMYVHCRTNLIDTFNTLDPDAFQLPGKRQILSTRTAIPTDELSHCIELALTYHLTHRPHRTRPTITGTSQRYAPTCR